MLSLLVNVPGIKICIYSTGKRASGSLLQIVLDFLQKVPGGSERIMKQNQEELFISPPNSKTKASSRSSFAKVAEGGSSVSKLFSYPSSVNGKITLLFHTHISIVRRCGPPWLTDRLKERDCVIKQISQSSVRERTNKINNKKIYIFFFLPPP